MKSPVCMRVFIGHVQQRLRRKLGKPCTPNITGHDGTPLFRSNSTYDRHGCVPDPFQTRHQLNPIFLFFQNRCNTTVSKSLVDEGIQKDFIIKRSNDIHCQSKTCIFKEFCGNYSTYILLFVPKYTISVEKILAIVTEAVQIG